MSSQAAGALLGMAAGVGLVLVGYGASELGQAAGRAWRRRRARRAARGWVTSEVPGPIGVIRLERWERTPGCRWCLLEEPPSHFCERDGRTLH